jgi:hypothetical protein
MKNGHMGETRSPCRVLILFTVAELARGIINNAEFFNPSPSLSHEEDSLTVESGDFMMDPMFYVDNAFVLGTVVILLRERTYTITLTLYFLIFLQCLSPCKIPLPFIMSFISHFLFSVLKI